MSYKITVIYPNKDPKSGEDIKFNMDYYLSTHMPLVSKEWHKHGLTGWEVIDVESGLGGAPPEYKVVAVLHYKSLDDFNKCVNDKESAGIVFGDVPNFSNVGPTLLVGRSLKHHSH